MFEGLLSGQGATGSTAILEKDGSIVFMYGTDEGKVFKKSFDSGRSFDDEWIYPRGSFTANNNLIRLKDGRLMITLKNEPENEIAREVGGADFTVTFSSDEGRTWSGENKVNKKSGCYYLMNNRILRLKSGRILIPLCYHPDEILSWDHFEKAGYSGCYYSDDEGATWSEGEWLKGENAGGMLAEPMVVENDSEEVLMYMRTGMGYLYYSKSTDGGMTFCSVKKTTLRSPNAPFTVSVDSYSGKFFAVWDNAFPSHIHQYPRNPICMAVSDDGVNWEFVSELDNNPDQNYGYPALFFTEKEIIVTYYFNETRQFNKSINQLKIKIYDRKELTVRKYYEEPLF